MANWTWVDDQQVASVDGVQHALTYQFTNPSLDDLAGMVSDASARLDALGKKTTDAQITLAWNEHNQQGTYTVTFTANE